MKEIQLTQDKVALVDDCDFERLNRFKWCAWSSGRTFYAVRNLYQAGQRVSTIRMHRLILNTPDNMETDHWDGNGLHNWRNNLRVCTGQQNQRNRKPRIGCSSNYKGVYWDKRSQKWSSRIFFDEKRKHLGYFISEFKAACAYDKAAKNYFGEFARLNFP